MPIHSEWLGASIYLVHYPSNVTAQEMTNGNIIQHLVLATVAAAQEMA